jgi:NAD(P)-dependent dehydrogenase (short-subunit alcohol dehydrogenase family)/acyl carrier protein
VEPALALPATPDRSILARAIEQTNENLAALQRFAEQTAQLHRQFLEGQAATQRTFHALLEQQHRLVLGGSVGPASPLSEPRPQVEQLSAGAVATATPPIHRLEPRSDGQASANGQAAAGPTAAPLIRPAREESSVAQTLVQVVAEKTGYPAEMLELDLQLDADLGIDSIKRVEILSAVQDRIPHAPAVRPDHIGTLRTLRQIAQFLASSAAADATAAARVKSPARGESSFAQTLVEVVAEKTGYPAEMLELDMQLDADLGIDSIKRVEILSAVQDRIPDAPAVKPEHLGTLRTLRQIARFLAQPTAPIEPVIEPESLRSERLPSARSAAVIGREPELASTDGTILQRLVPRVTPLPELDLRETLTLAPGCEIWLTDEGSPLTAALRSLLATRGHAVRVVALSEPDLPAPCGDVAGLIVLASVAGSPPSFVKNTFRLVREVGPSLRKHGRLGGAALLTVIRFDGSFGLGGLKEQSDPTTGALAGIVKTAGREWPEVNCKALDLDARFASSQSAAARIVEELERLGPSEVGITDTGKRQVETLPLPSQASGGRQEPVLRHGEVVVVSGGARGITAEVAFALATSFRPRLVLLGRTPIFPEEPDWLTGLESDTAILREIRNRHDGPGSPQELNERLRLIHARREIRRNIRRIEAAGSEVTYHGIDARDHAGVRNLLQRIRAESGPVRGLIHGAGVLADRRIEDQSDEQFAEVFDTKVEGLRALLGATDPRDLRFLALFSSSTARFGRAGQVAYAAANECLNKWAERERLSAPECRVVAFNWGPWDGGMVTTPLKHMFEREGLGLIAPEAGASLLIEEIQRSSEWPVEIVVLAEPAPRSSAAVAAPLSASPEHGGNGKLVAVFERMVDLRTVPVIQSHVIDGHAVLPLALILEWLAEGALLRHPGMVVQGVDNLRLFKGVVLRDGKPARLSIRVGKLQARGDAQVITVELHGVLESGRELVHVRAEVVVADRYPAPERLLTATSLAPMAADREHIYRRVLFHGPAMQAIERVEGCDERAIAAWVSTSPPPASWMERPLRQNWLTDPLALDGAFQVLVLWTKERLGSSSLPTAVGVYRQYRRAFPAGGVRVLAVVRQFSDHRALADIEFLDAQGIPVARIESYECVIDSSLNQAFRRNRLNQLEGAAS